MPSLGGEPRIDSMAIGVAVIGAGIMGNAHAGAVLADARARLIGFASVPIDGARALAAKYGAPVATDDYRELLKRSDVDLVVIATPDHLHTEIAIATARAGKAFLVEKPLATSLAEASIPEHEAPRRRASSTASWIGCTATPRSRPARW